MRSIVVIAHDLRSCHNVGSLLRTCEGLGVAQVYLTGYTPYPVTGSGDSRLPHLAAKLDKQIHKTALGAERLVAWHHAEDIFGVLAGLKGDGYTIVALEQTPAAVPLPRYHAPAKIALILGREVEGIDQAVLDAAAVHLVIPMSGRKESFNVVQAAAMTLYQLRFY